MKKVVLVTGASSGIGRAIAQYLVKKNFIVYGTSRSPKQEEEEGVVMLRMDVRDENTIKEVFEHILSKESRIDVVVNNAGVGITGPLEEIPMEEIQNNFDTNLFGPIRVMKNVLPLMREQKSGLIINVTSIAGYMGLPFRSVYSSSKGALELITEALRMEVKQFGIQITNVAPGDFATDIASRRYHTLAFEHSAYYKVYKKQLDTMDDHVSSGLSTNVMAEAVYRIIQTQNPKIHYKIGAFMQKFSIVLKRILPDKVYEKLLMNHYKL